MRLLTALVALSVVWGSLIDGPYHAPDGQDARSLEPAKRLFAHLDSSQHSADCAHRGRSFLLFEYGLEAEINGFGAMFQFLAGALALAQATNRTLVESVASDATWRQDAWQRAPEQECGGMKLGCYLRPLSSCLFTGSVPSVTHLDPLLAPQAARIVRIREIALYAASLRRATEGDFAPPYWRSPSWCAAWPGLAGATPAECWRVLWFPFLQRWLFRPLSDSTLMRSVAASAECDENAVAGACGRFAVGLHVRRGDTLHLPWRYHATLDVWAAVVRDVLTRLQNGGRDSDGSLSFFIATDSSTFGLQLAERLRADFRRARVLGAGLTHPSGTPEAEAERTVNLEKLLEGLRRGEQGARRAHTITAGTTISDTHARIRVAGMAVSVVHSSSMGMRQAALDAASMVPLLSWCAEHVGAALPACGHAAGPIEAEGVSAAYRVTASVVEDIWALSHAAAIIGTCFSQVSRIAYSLQLAAGRARTQAVALDQEACLAFAHTLSVLAPWVSI